MYAYDYYNYTIISIINKNVVSETVWVYALF